MGCKNRSDRNKNNIILKNTIQCIIVISDVEKLNVIQFFFDIIFLLLSTNFTSRRIVKQVR